ncbi:hypothetical protein QQ056_19515 [Oscillatoria laete-virens NRMC-F 0139]|nr:hypothetical protein [Oscillatoria laete-virens]MDL5055721.1 hypothetical protein [Oscillatoria laete-virens NRMC-F 0139]
MGSQLDSFDQSSLGAFMQSPLGMRGLEEVFGAIYVGPINVFGQFAVGKSDNALTWAQSAAASVASSRRLPVSVLSDKVLYSSINYSSRDLSTFSAYGANDPKDAVVRIGSTLCCADMSSTSSGRILRSIDGGVSWTRVSLPTLSGFVQTILSGSRIIVHDGKFKIAGTLIDTSTFKSYPVCWSSSDGISWTVGTPIVLAKPDSPQNTVLYSNGGDLFLLVRLSVITPSEIYVSSTGTSWTFVGTGPAGFPSFCPIVMPSGRVIFLPPKSSAFTPNLICTDNNGASYTTLQATANCAYFVGPDYRIWRINCSIAPTPIQVSTNEGTSFSTVASTGFSWFVTNIAAFNEVVN